MIDRFSKPFRLRLTMLAMTMVASAASGQQTPSTRAASVGVPTAPEGDASRTTDLAAAQRAMATVADMLKGVAAGVNGQEMPATQPVTPERLALGRRVLTEIGLTDVFKPMAEAHYQHVLPKLQQSSAGLPPAQRRMLDEAMHRAIDTAMADRAQATLDDAARYFAERLSDADLALAADFYAGEVGRQSLHAATQTAANKQATGRFMLDHPGFVRFEKVLGSYDGHAIKQHDAAEAAYAAAFKAHFCRNLAADRITLPSCPAAHRS